MKKKRFIKLLMGEYCMDRNTARKAAENIHRRGGSYLVELAKTECLVRMICAEFGVPRSVALCREKGFEKEWRRHKRAMHRGAQA